MSRYSRFERDFHDLHGPEATRFTVGERFRPMDDEFPRALSTRDAFAWVMIIGFGAMALIVALGAVALFVVFLASAFDSRPATLDPDAISEPAILD